MKYRFRRFRQLSFLIFLCSLLIFEQAGFGKEIATIRVAIVKDASEPAVAVTGAYEVLDARSGKGLSTGKKLAFTRLKAVAGGLRLGSETFFCDAIILSTNKSAGITVDGRRYRGKMTIYKKQDGRFLIVNTLNIESYVKGVLYHEISHKWPMDAIKAQAVATRTYAFYQKEVMKSKEYDVYADTSSQVYGGYFAEKSKTNRAVNFTFGEVLLFNNKIFPAYFHATCGGMTEDAAELWKIDLKCLKGGRACSYCLESPHYYWKTQLQPEEIQKKLKELYLLKRALKNIAVAERTATGRIRTLELKSDDGKTQKIAAKDFRMNLGADQVRSTNFLIVVDQGKFLLKGRGWGHGVGLCQWGALGMSKQGASYSEILEFYYPESRVARLY